MHVGFYMQYIFSTLTFLLLIGVVVVVHELGHLIIARMNGVFCEAFSFGFGPVLLKKKDKKGTEWRFSLFPLGGYVKMLGDADVSSVREVIPDGYTDEEMEKMSAHRKKPWQRLLISFGGPFANFVIAIMVFLSLSVINGIPEYDNKITVVSEQSVAYVNGLRTGDVITKANGQEVSNFNDIASQVKKSIGNELKLCIDSNGTVKDITIKMVDENGQHIKSLGITPQGFKYKEVSFVQAIKSSIVTTYTIANENIKSIFKLASGEMSTKNVGGIISIFKASSESADAGIISFITMIAMISAVLGAINLLPIPVLDGGSIVISAIEWIIGRPLNKSFVNAIFMIGLVAVVGLMALGMWNDLQRVKFFSFVWSLFK